MSMYLIKSRRPKVDVKPRVQRIYRVLEGKRRKCEIHIFNLEGLVGIIRAIDYFLTPEQALNILKFYTRINPLMLYSSNHNKKAMVASFDPSNNIDYVNELSEEDIQGTQYIVGYRHQYHRTPIWDLVETQSAEQAFKNIVRSRMHIPDGKCIEDPQKL